MAEAAGAALPIGLPFLLENDSIESAAALCQSLGLAFVELNSNFPACLLPRLKPKELNSLAQTYGCFYTLHLDDSLDPFDLNDAVRKASVGTVLRALDIAAETGMPIVNIHFPRGNVVTLPDGKHYIYQEYPDEFRETVLAFRTACEKAAAGSGVLVAVENTDGWENYELDAISLLLESPVFALTLDIGHDHATGGRDLSFILKHQHRLKHMHAHDGRDRVNHQALGTGEIPVLDRLRLAGETGATVVLETKTVAALTQSVDYLRGHGLLDAGHG